MKFIKKFKNWNPSKLATILILMLPFCYFAITKFKLDNDFWFLINTGKTILEKGFIRIEPFTIHENFLFIPQQWLTDIIFYLIYNKFNIIGILILELIINSLIVFLIYKSSLLVSKKRSISIYITLIIDFLFLTTGILTTRPQMFDIVFFLLELFLLESYIQKKKNIYLYFIPLLSLLLINLHASTWLMLFVFLVPYYFEYIIKKIRRLDTFNLRPIIIITIISLLVGFLNPYGIDSITYLFHSYGIKEINDLVGEMHAVDIRKGIIEYVFIFIGFLAFYKNKGNNKIRYILLFLGTTYLSLSHYKGFLFLLVTFGIVLGDCFKGINNKMDDIKLIKLEKIIYCMLIVGLIIFISLSIRVDSEPKLKELANYLDKNTTKDIKLYTGYNNGSYLEYRGYKCYIDPRAEVFLKANNKKEDIILEYYNLNILKIDVNDFLNKYDFDYLVIDRYDKYLLMEVSKNKKYEKVLEVEDKELDVTYNLYRRINEEAN